MIDIFEITEYYNFFKDNTYTNNNKETYMEKLNSLIQLLNKSDYEELHITAALLIDNARFLEIPMSMNTPTSIGHFRILLTINKLYHLLCKGNSITKDEFINIMMYRTKPF